VAIADADVKWLELRIDHYNDALPPLKEFILPGGGLASAQCHLARTTCRRAERSLVALSRHETVPALALAFVNRLSDLLFVLTRVLARASGHAETLWEHGKRVR
jgi:cob(I)alamin adenosyltransferase